MSPETTIIATLVAYKTILIGFGIVGERRTRDGVDYFLGGRRLGPTVAALSASASSSSAWTLLGVSGAAYAWGLSAVWLFPACVGGFLINWFILAPALRRHSHATGAVTVTEVLAGPPGSPGRRAITVVASLIVVVSLTTYVASQFLGAGKSFSETFDLSQTHSILIGAAVVLFYTLLGGFWGVSLTDTLQGLVMAIACIVLPLVALAEVGGFTGLANALGALPVDGYLDVFAGAGRSSGIGFVAGVLGIGLGYPGQPHVVNRFMALRQGATELRRGRAIAIVWAVVVYSGMLLLGWCGRVFAGNLEDGERVFIHAARGLLDPVLAGVMLAAVLSAIMSTADSQLLVAASAVAHDLGLGGHSQRNVLRRSRLVVLTICAVAVGAALGGSQAIFDRVLFAWTAMGAAFGPLLLVTVLRGAVGPWRSLGAMTVGFTLSVAFHSFDATRGTTERWAPFLVAFAIVLWPRRAD